MTGIIDVGGGLRGIFGTGVFDKLLENEISFDYMMGVSAGAANIASFLGKQKGRNLLFYTEYALRPEYMGFKNLLKNGSYLNLSYVYGTLSNSDGENPLDFKNMSSFKGQVITVTTDAATGKAIYYPKGIYAPDDYKILMATCCLPIACRPINIDGHKYFDGGVADPIPIKKAVTDGCDKIVLILTRPKDELRQAGVDKKAAFLLKRKYPELAKALANRYMLYNESIKYAKMLEKEGKALIIAPDSRNGLKTLTKDTEKLMALYKNGYEKAEEIIRFITE